METPHEPSAAIRAALLQTCVSNLLLAGLLFIPAGTLSWPRAWAFIALLDVCGLALGWWLLRRDPMLLTERSRSALGADQRVADRAIMVAILVFFVAWLVLVGLDAGRFRWSRMPTWLAVVGAVLIVASYGGWVGVLRANTFAASQIRLQPERGQIVVATGPYAIVRHPMYAWVPPLLAGSALMLGSWYGLASAALVLPLLAARALSEETLLMEGLAGYRDYAATVRFRLIPAVW